MAKAPARVRGMNAAAMNAASTNDASTDTASPHSTSAHSAAGQPVSLDAAALNGTSLGGTSLTGASGGSAGHRGGGAGARFPHASMRQLLVSVALLACGCVMAWYTFTEVTGGPKSFSGTVEPQQSVGLDFSTAGRVAQVFVKPGDKVVKGQPLAAEGLDSAKATLADAQAVLAADEAKVRAMQSPTLSAAARQSLDSQVAGAGSELSGARQAAADAIAAANAQILQAQQMLSGARTVLAADSAQLASACPDGAAPTGGGPDGDSGTATDTPSPPAAGQPDCPGLHAQVQKDSATVGSAAANLTHVKAEAAQLRNSAASAASGAQTALDSARGKKAAAASPASAAELAAAQADVAAARRTVDQDKQLLADLTLTSPIDGIVADVGGVVGDLDGTGGVHTLPGPRAIQRGSGPAFSLFPPSAGADSSEAAYGRQQPLVSLVSSQNRAQAQVGEASVKDLHPGRRARVTVNALGRTVDGTVAQVIPIPVDQDGKVNYQVLLTVPAWPAGLMPGMSLSVVFP